MSEKLDNSIGGESTQQITSADTVADLLELCAPHQRALLSVLAVAERHDLDPVPLIISLAEEMPVRDRGRAMELASQISAGVNPVTALELIPNLMPPATVLALKLADTDGDRSDLNLAWLDRFPGNQTVTVRLPEETVPILARLALRVFVVVSVITFIMLKIIPEFQKMFEEFGLELPSVTRLCISICDRFMNLWFIPFLFAICMIPFCIPAIRRYLHRWSPLKWQQRTFSAPVNRKRSMALIAQTKTSLRSSIATVLQGSSLSRIFPGLGKANANIESGQNEWESLAAERVISNRDAKALALTTSGDTQAWLLRWSAADLQNRKATHRTFWLRFFVISIDLILAGLVILTCLGIFMSYLHIVNSL